MECEYVSEDKSMECPSWTLLVEVSVQNTSSKRDSTLHIFSLCLLSSLIMRLQSLIAVALSLGFTLFAVSLPLSPKRSIHSPNERRPVTYPVVQVGRWLGPQLDSGSPNVNTGAYTRPFPLRRPNLHRDHTSIVVEWCNDDEILQPLHSYEDNVESRADNPKEPNDNRDGLLVNPK
ncbi:hypothetical protein CIHG_02773 [Coccidioides immitis H538.4]|uniref:Uncharacterized protein n=1 Tax=Coccidioides immitis H538.4 TaxID=396776 RepID=A0A0J8RIN8_COCIT|nr:hypothetical protein CIHG_02773 [Coccidioides immitis H538.4]